MNFNNTVVKNKFPKSLNVFILQSYDFENKSRGKKNFSVI